MSSIVKLKKERVDTLLVKYNLSETRSKAQAMIMAGQVFVENKKIIKSSETYLEGTKFKIKELHPEWVSRGALKLTHAINNFNINIKNKICLDIGSSTGGFSQVLLKGDAKKIYSIDVGKNQLHEKLRNEKKIISMEKTNARYIDQRLIKDKIDLIVCDVSFISMKIVLKNCVQLLNRDSGIVIGLIKPQFETSKNEIKKGGIIKDEKVHQRICSDFEKWFKNELSMNIIGIALSPILGQKGNKEFLIAADFN